MYVLFLSLVDVFRSLQARQKHGKSRNELPQSQGGLTHDAVRYRHLR